MAKVSIVIPTHNSCSSIRSTINSVQIQERTTLEIITVDDKSTDDTVQKVSKSTKGISRIRIITKQKVEPAIVRLTGLTAANNFDPCLCK